MKRYFSRKSFLQLLMGAAAVTMTGCGAVSQSASSASSSMEEVASSAPEAGGAQYIDFVQEYSVTPTEDIDIAATLQEAFNSLAQGGTIHLANGIYAITSPLELKSDMTLEMDDNAVLLNKVNGSPSMIAFNHPVKAAEAVGNSHIKIIGGVFDMNGYTSNGEYADAVPEADSTCALGFAYAEDFTLTGVTFKNAYNGHAIQIAGSTNVLIEDCSFIGQGLQGSGNKTRELVQIEPGTVKGYPYTLVQNNALSSNVTIKGCYFGPSEECPDFMVGLGTHSQIAQGECSDILIEDCTFDNPVYAGIHFMAYKNMTIRGNTFLMSPRDSSTDRYGILADTYGSMIDPKGAASTTDLTIEKNQFDTDGYTVALAVLANNGSPKKFSGVDILENTFTNNGNVDESPAVILDRLVDVTVTENTVTGYASVVVAKKCSDEVSADCELITEG